jgi:hypothetical protein
MSAASTQDITGSLATGVAAIIWGPFDFRGDSTPWKVVVYASGNSSSGASFRLIFEAFDGTSWSTMDSLTSSAITQGPDQSGTPVNRTDTTAANKEWRCGVNNRIRLVNLGANSLNFFADVRTVQAG